MTSLLLDLHNFIQNLFTTKSSACKFLQWTGFKNRYTFTR